MENAALDIITLLGQFSFARSMLQALPPDINERLLVAIELWGAPQEELQIVEVLRQAHGPLLSLLDAQVNALRNLGEFAKALELVERRQRRSSSLAGRINEASLLLALGYKSHARTIANDLSQSAKRNAPALCIAAEIYSAEGDFDRARQLLEEYLAQRPGDLQVVLTLAQLAYRSGERSLAETYIQRLGAGVANDLDSALLKQEAELLGVLGYEQMLHATEVELQRRRQRDLAELEKLLAPYLLSSDGRSNEIEEVYRKLHGPDSLPASAEEQRRVLLEAARHFGFSKLRIGQTETIAAVLRGESLLAVMPTGAGKSLCYQLPALTKPRASLIISPLIALMKDQVENLPMAARNKATFINSTLSDEEMTQRMSGIARGDYKLIYAAPERLRQLEFLYALRDAGIDLFVIDEAHCVSMWGHDFRPDYLFLQEARSELNNPPTLAMTATAPPRVRDEIVSYLRNNDTLTTGQLGVKNNTEHRVSPATANEGMPHVLSLDIFRHNLHLSALRFNNEEEKLIALLQFVKESEGSGIIYANSRHRCESLAYQLQQAGISAEAYHAGRDDRSAIQDRFMSNRTRVVVATIAFGMGIDKSDIRFIVHFHPPRSLANYYQEVGRAGRDGKTSQGLLFYSNNDWVNLRRWAKADEYSIEFLEKVYTAIAMQLGVPTNVDASPATPAGADSASAGNDKLPAADQPAKPPADAPDATMIGAVDGRRLQQVLNVDDTTARVAVSMLERADLLVRGFDLPQEISILLPMAASVSKTAAARPAKFERLLKGLALRPGQSASFKTVDIAKFMHWSLENCERNLLDWQSAGWLKIRGGKRVMLIELLAHPADIRPQIERLLAQSTAVAQRRIDEMVGYATAETCRHGYISAHFGSPPRNHCPVCDNCTGVRPELEIPPVAAVALPDDADIEPMVIDCLLSIGKAMGRGGLARVMAGSVRAPVTPDQARHHGSLKGLGESAILQIIDDLLENGRLRQYERQGYPVLAATLRGRIEAETWLAQHPELGHYGLANAPSDETNPETNAAGEDGQEKYTALQKALWLWRRTLAQQFGQPAYLIMSNDLMLRIAESRPQSLEELAKLPGIGAQRLEYYGPAIIDLVKLNPVQPGDSELLKTQWETAQNNDGQAGVAKKAQAVRPTAQEAALLARIERQVFMKLQEMRQKKAITQRLKAFEIAGNALLQEIARRAPDTQAELEQIPGFVQSRLYEEAGTILTNIATIKTRFTASKP